MTSYWQHYPHGADIGIRGFGASLASAFEQAAVALTAVITDPGKVREKESVIIKCNNVDPELLFTDWINSIIYEMAVRKMLFSGFKVDLNGDKLIAEISGEQVDILRHQPAVEIKGATFTTLKVIQNSDLEWMVQTVVDV